MGLTNNFSNPIAAFHPKPSLCLLHSNLQFNKLTRTQPEKKKPKQIILRTWASSCPFTWNMNVFFSLVRRLAMEWANFVLGFIRLKMAAKCRISFRMQMFNWKENPFNQIEAINIAWHFQPHAINKHNLQPLLVLASLGEKHLKWMRFNPFLSLAPSLSVYVCASWQL